METATLAAAAFAGALVVLTPGPAVLALLAIGAGQGRVAGGRFIVGHLAGDLVWAALALAALIGAQVTAPWLFRGLALVCAGYLGWLGLAALLSPVGEGRDTGALARNPLRRGIIFGLTNPKSYPVTLSIFAALLAHDPAALAPENAPLLLAACFLGFLVADVILIAILGSRPVRRFYRVHERWIVRGTGAMFLFFAGTTAWHALAA